MARTIKINKDPDVVLIGAGIMSATLGAMLKELQPDLTIHIYERLDIVAGESSDAWNNAGTGHSAFCELNYTPQTEDGHVDISKAIKIAEMFEVSREFWAYLVGKGALKNPKIFINQVPHMSFVIGEKDVEYLDRRHESLTTHHLFQGMKYSEDPAQLREWMPLMMEGRNDNIPLAATKMDEGTDVNFGSLTRCLIKHINHQKGVRTFLHHEVRDLEQEEDGRWKITFKDLACREKKSVHSKFVFIGAGGAALTLLEKSGIPEAKGYGGFPVSGQWLICNDEELIQKHAAKVYGKAKVGAPPMSVPHLDTRIINGRKALLFGPYAGFSTKFLKNGSWLDLPLSITLSNIRPMIAAGLHNFPLTRYLIDQVTQSSEEKLEALNDFIPGAKMKDWDLEIAGQRVQVIKRDEEKGGKLEFGTEVVSSADGTIAALLGASPGASVSVSIMLDLLNKCFPDKMKTDQWQDKLKEMILSYGASLSKDADLCQRSRDHTGGILQLNKNIRRLQPRQTSRISKTA
jgi:malate dehydrogenase (quinone)